MRVRTILLAFVAAFALRLQPATAEEAPAANAGFSFAVYGDSRSMMYLPPKDGRTEILRDVAHGAWRAARNRSHVNISARSTKPSASFRSASESG